LEFKSEKDQDWQEHNGVVRHRPRNNEYKATVRNLIESTEYFFRVRVVGKGDKRGKPSPSLNAVTLCGREFLSVFNQISIYRTRRASKQRTTSTG
jgi:hypothetical protein